MKDILMKPVGMVVSKAAPVLMKVSKRTPEILLAAGVASILGGTALACRTTWTKLPERLNDKNDELYEAADEDGEVAPKDKTAAYLRMAGGVTRDYMPAALLLAGGVTMVVSGHVQLRTRLAAVGAAYATLDEAYSSYRARVIEDYGEEVDKKFRYGVRNIEVKTTKVGKNGKEKEVVEVHEGVHADGSGYSLYTRYFDQFNTDEYRRDQEANFDFLRLQENIANEKFNRQGYLFLNDVYEALGFKKVPEGQLVGWVKGHGDDYVDFGIWESRNAYARDFVNHNYDDPVCFVLDFNVDGVMWDLI